ncbi:hypothetical protein M9H77_36622 [Catharanthus roseus]|uniref:Uncharacterized protein n=1 Tax=Catharanthus roseus TaxID=4058 RepID=A0ACB9ZSB5_CATRO|nr:hypothetical protein M9H77_36622 [Catharanthus roseus]
MPSDQFVWLPYLECGLVPSDLWRAELHDQPILATYDTRLDLHHVEMITCIGRRRMLLMWKSCMSGDNILGMAFSYTWNSYHRPEMITLYSIGILHESTLRIQYVISMLQETDDMTTGVLEGPLPSPTRYANVMRKVQTIIRWCIVSIGGTLDCTPSQHDVQQTFAVQPSRRHPRESRGTRRLPCGRACGGRALAPSHSGTGFDHGG